MTDDNEEIRVSGKGSGNNKEHDVDSSTQFLANERTFLALLRTCIAVIGLGFVVARFSLFLREFGLITMTRREGGAIQQDLSLSLSSSSSAAHSPSSLLGPGMVGLGIALAGYAFYNYKKAHRIIESGEAMCRSIL
ncbi:YidH family protein [Candidatus Nitrososphaera evergladensis]|uniref:YidH family protein n=1 Tax=Candidatus Nitrososphaera evergladensis TaxID=1459637 RepID=UPI00130E4CBA|nr:DUF202 domain-containing protein [Candidatus Nitrososphaera evergladensis]